MVSLATFLLALPCITVKSLVISHTPSLTLPSTTTTNSTSSNPSFQCNGDVYGYNLDWESCTEAMNQIDASSTTEQTYGQRYQGRFDVRLPKRYISCSYFPILLAVMRT